MQDVDTKEIDFSWLLELIKDKFVTDIHIKPYGVSVRRNKRLIRVPVDYFEKMGIDPSTWNKDFLNKYGIDSTLTLNGIRIRAHVEESNRGYVNAVRILPSRIKTWDELGLPAVFKKYVTYRRGGILFVIGEMNSGKTTTIAALIHEINQTTDKNVAVYEDPVEVLHDPLRSLVDQFNVSVVPGGGQGEAYAERIRAIKRMDVDVAVIGETRDPEALEAIFDLAESGIFVMTTTHAESVPDLFHKLIYSMPPEKKDLIRYQMASLIKGIIYQMLVESPDEKMALLLEYAIPDIAMKEMIRSKEDKIHQIAAHIQTKEGQKNPGFRSFERSLSDAVAAGKIDEDTAASILNKD